MNRGDASTKILLFGQAATHFAENGLRIRAERNDRNAVFLSEEVEKVMKRTFDVFKLVIILHGARRVNEAAEMNRDTALGFRRLEVNGRPLGMRLDGKRLELHGFCDCDCECLLFPKKANQFFYSLRPVTFCTGLTTKCESK